MITVRPIDANDVLFLLDDLYKQMEESCSEDTKEDFCAIFSTVFNNLNFHRIITENNNKKVIKKDTVLKITGEI